MIIKYYCEICEQAYDTAKKALACENQKVEQPIAKVGDIVTSRAGFGWFNGDQRWIVNFKKLGMPITPGKFKGANPAHKRLNCFDTCCTYQFYYVVTAITHQRQSHKLAYHLATRAMSEGTRHNGGWTNPDGHFGIELVVKPPKFVVESSKSLIGKEFRWLL